MLQPITKKLLKKRTSQIEIYGNFCSETQLFLAANLESGADLGFSRVGRGFLKYFLTFC